MDDREVDKLLALALSGGGAEEVFRQRVLRDSMGALGADRRVRTQRRVARVAVAAVLLAAVSFLSGRISAPPASREAPVATAPTTDDAQAVSVPGELVAWLQAARFFKQLGMEQRVTLAYERAGALIPADVTVAGDSSGFTYAVQIDSSEDRQERSHREATLILAHSLGG